jgi:superfamily I DNA/RNA helicase
MPPPPERGQAWHEYWERVPTLLLDAYASSQARTGTYQAILVDEGQDFANDWYRVILKGLDPSSNSLFIALDSSQNIYNRKTSWRELGVDIVGHSRVLRVNYRNTRPILDAAYRMISELDSRSNMARESRTTT